MKCIDCLEYAELGDGRGICLVKSSIKKIILVKNPEQEIKCDDFDPIDDQKYKNNDNFLKFK